jgi:hypothetical protein
VVHEKRLGFFIRARQRNPGLRPMHRAAALPQAGGRALRMHDPAPGCHPVDVAGLDWLDAAKRIAMVDHALE